MIDPTIIPEDFFSNFTVCDTPEDSLVYPGRLNTDKDGNPYITPNSGPEDFKRSILEQARKMGVKHPYEIAIKNVNKKIPTSVVNDLADPKNPGKVPSQEEMDRFFLLSTPGLDQADYQSKLLDLEEPIDPRALLPDLNTFTHTGDPRWSDGCAMQNVFQKFYPILEAYKEIVQMGPVVLDQDCCYCSEDGVKIKEASAYVKHALISICGTTVAPLSTIQPPTITEIYNYMDEQKERAYVSHAAAFITWFKKNYPESQWTWDLVYTSTPPFFFIKVENSSAIERDIKNKVLKPIPNPEIKPEIKVQSTTSAPTSKTTTPQVVTQTEITYADIQSGKYVVPPNQFNKSHVDVIRYYSDMRSYVSEELKRPIQNVKSFGLSWQQSQNVSILKNLSSPIPDYTKMI